MCVLNYRPARPAERIRNRAPFRKTDVFAYAFRHSYCQRLADAGVPQETLRRLMDHRSADTTAQYYTVTNARKRNAIECPARFQCDGCTFFRSDQSHLPDLTACCIGINFSKRAVVSSVTSLRAVRS